MKHVLDSCLKEYIHKAVGIVGVSAGPFGRTRVIQNLLPVMREIGLVTIFWDVNFSSVQKVFGEDGKLLDESYIRRIDKFLKELIWMAKTLPQGSEHISLDWSPESFACLMTITTSVSNALGRNPSGKFAVRTLFLLHNPS